MSIRSESSISSSEEWWRVTFSGIGDGVIVTDVTGAVAYMNQMAENLTGWKMDESRGRPLETVFSAINEQSGESIESPVRIALRTGEVSKLPDHSALQKHNGGAVRINDSATPIYDVEGNLIGAVLVFRDVSDRRRAEMAQLYLSAIITSSDDAIISKTLDGRITSWNAAAERIFGYTPEEAIGKHITILIPTERLKEEEMIIERLKRGERIEHYETIRLRKDGTPLNISLTISPIKNHEDKIIGASKIARDITEQKRILEREHQALEKAEAANRLKDEFLSTLSHELRTPLNAMLGWATLLRRGVGPEQFEMGLETIERNVRIQTQIVEDLLDLSRMMTGKMRLDVRLISLPEVIYAASEAMRPAAEAKGVRLQIIIDNSAGHISGDPNRLQQVFYNLLSNAIKFTPKGGRVQVLLERVNSHLEVSVIDTGIGIDPKFLPYVFDRFRQADSTSKREYGGLGIGLSIVRQLVEMHGGSVRVKSQGEGQGATFIVGLPMAAIQRADSGAWARPKATGQFGDIAPELPDALDGVTVLVVDDEADSQELIRLLLESVNANVITAHSAEAGLKILASQKVDVLVSDIGLPVVDGLEFIARIRALGKDRGGDIPAVALTAFARSEDRTRALLAGFNIHVAKPVEPSELIATILTLARTRH